MILLLVAFRACSSSRFIRRRPNCFDLGSFSRQQRSSSRGALEYAPNLMAVWGSFNAPDTWTDRLAAFWFDVTKQDWRETMVLGVSSRARGRPAGHVGVRRATTVRYLRPRPGAAGCRRTVAKVARMGSAGAHCVRGDNRLRPHLQRRRLSRVLPAGALHRRILRGRRRRLSSRRPAAAWAQVLPSTLLCVEEFGRSFREWSSLRHSLTPDGGAGRRGRRWIAMTTAAGRN